MTNPTERPEERDSLARAFHETYERLAPEYGYETRPESAVPWEQVPENNRRLMQAVVAEVCSTIINEVKELREENERLKGVVVEVQRHRIVPESEVLEEAHVRLEQMEEALREAEPYLWNAPLEGALDVHAKLRAALSPSDTEEEA